MATLNKKGMLKRIVGGASVSVAVCGLFSVVGGCLDRPVVSNNPITRANFIQQVQQSSIDKVDILFDIDNSASMGDKQAYLAQAIPDLIGRLVQPNCVDLMGNPTGQSADVTGACPGTSTAEFSPVHNMHVGIVSSSLGGRLGTIAGIPVCPTTTQIPDKTDFAAWQPLAGGSVIDRHNDDQAHLLSRSSDPMNLTNYTETPLNDAIDSNPGNGGFLDWFPKSNMNNANATPTGPAPIMQTAQLESDFSSLVVGVHQFGCGIESQLETWYRFLIQPDPYATLTTVSSSSGQVARWSGVDTTILAQRADFLRPDSLVAIIVLTDENDSEVDVRTFGGSGYQFMSEDFNPPKSTSACAAVNGMDYTGLKDPNCTSCEFNPNDPACSTGTAGSVQQWPTSPPAAPNWGYDLNLRHVHEKLKYGADVQFPIQRYLIGLTSTKVPNRDGEYPPDGKGGEASSYQGLNAGNLNCTNPLFAAKLPVPPNGNLSSWQPSYASGNPTPDPNNDLCNMTVGQRQPSLVYYAHIGGVPHQLLQNNPNANDQTSQSQKDTLTDADWQLILGKDPLNYDYTGIDAHMIEDYKPRTTYPTGKYNVAPETSAEGTDPISGREWITDSTDPKHVGLTVDREYACIFPLTDPTTGAAKPRDCSNAAVMADPTLNESCDCLQPTSGMFTQSELPAVCNDAMPTQQDSAKAYPTIRELLLAKLMAQQGIISSLCPIHTSDNAAHNDPLYGYRPAMNAIVNRLKASLGITCLPQPLTIGSDSKGNPAVQCLVLGTFPQTANIGNDCGSVPGGGWSSVDPTILSRFRADQHASWLASGNTNSIDPSSETTCQLAQLAPNVNCGVKASTTNGQTADGWCYVQNPTQTCAQAILFSANAQIEGVVTSLQCLEQAPNDL